MSQVGAGRRAREVRIGLVMYGGVSLAIYMNGVTQELFRAVRGRGVYKLFKTLTSSDVVVDVVSGASAGGINGIFLAYALCNDREFSTCAGLWREHGDILKLLRKADASPETQTSLLDSEGFYEPQLTAAFRQMWDRPVTPGAAAKEAPSPVQELDLFVAGTDFHGRVWDTVDAAAHVIDVKDHRTLFWLKHRQGRKLQLDPRAQPDGKPVERSRGPELEVGLQAFAKLARITSCFPAAFAPVPVEVPPAAPRGPNPPADDPASAVDRKLGLWGGLREGRYFFLDGGVLDNKPFSSTVRTIFYRLANRPVQRHLLYVEPDPERFAASDKIACPSFIAAALDSLTRLPSYESIADDLRLIAEHNDKIERYKRTCAHLRRTVMSTPRPPEAPPDVTDELFRRARLQALGELVIGCLLNLERSGRRDDTKPRLERASLLRKQFDHRIQELADPDALFRAFDVAARIRRLIHLTYVLMPDADEVTGVSASERQQALDHIGRRIELLEILRAYVERALQSRAEAWQALSGEALWEAASGRLRALLDRRGLADDLVARIARDELAAEDLEALKNVLRRRAEGEGADPGAGFESLLDSSDRGEQALCARFPPVEAEYRGFPALDRVLFPMQFMAELHERDIIRTIRVSPHDARRALSNRALADKVCGDAVGHFGGFLKRSWRSNDLLWGRLDGACQIIETLLNRSWVEETLGDPAARREALAALQVDPDGGEPRAPGIAQWLTREEIFPRATAAALTAAAEALAALLDPTGDRAAFEARLGSGLHERLLDALVEACQLDILAEDLPSVVEDAVSEQIAWKQTPERAAGAGKAATFNVHAFSFDGVVDDAAVTAAARKLASDALADPQRNGLGPYFTSSYRVGAESVESAIPQSVLLEMAAHGLRVMRNCVVNSLSPGRARDVRRNSLYKVFVDWPLRAFHELATTLRRAPARLHLFAAGAWIYFALALVVNVTSFQALYRQVSVSRVVAMFVLVVLPVVSVVVTTLALLPWPTPDPGSRARRRRQSARAVMAIASAFATLLVVVGSFYWLGSRLTPMFCEGVDGFWAEACEAGTRTSGMLMATLVGVAVGALLLRRPAGR